MDNGDVKKPKKSRSINIEKLERLIDMLRDKGVLVYEENGVKLVLSPQKEDLGEVKLSDELHMPDKKPISWYDTFKDDFDKIDKLGVINGDRI